MKSLRDMIHGDQHLGGDAFLRLTCSATGDWTDQYGNSVGTTTTSGIYLMKPDDKVIHAVSAAADAVAIIVLPPVGVVAGEHFFIMATTGAAGGDY